MFKTPATHMRKYMFVLVKIAMGIRYNIPIKGHNFGSSGHLYLKEYFLKRILTQL